MFQNKLETLPFFSLKFMSFFLSTFQ